MKALFFFLALCLAASAARGTTLYGTIYNAGTSKAVTYQKVYVLDSLTNYFDSTLTDAAGAYSFQLTGRVDSNDVLLVYTTGCGKKVSAFYRYSGGNIVANLYICPALYSLNGTVSLNGNANNGPARLFLLSKHFDTLRADTVLSVVDTIFTDAYGGTYSKTYSVIPSGTLLLKAELLRSHPQYGNYAPTWLGGALVWSNAQPLSASNFSVSTATGINLIPVVSTGGYAAASGTVTTPGVNTGSGKPLEGRLLLLTNAAGTSVGFTLSDSLGQFSFSGLAYGTYKLFGDSWGRLNPALTFTLTAARPGIEDIIFEEDSTSFRGRFGATTGIGAVNAWSRLRIFPNPASSAVSLAGLNDIEGTKSLRLRDMKGALLLQRRDINTDLLKLDLSALPAGIYALELSAAGRVAVFRLQKL